MLVCCRDGDAEANALSGRRHGWNNSQRLRHRPLRTGNDGGVEGLLVDIIATFCVKTLILWQSIEQCVPRALLTENIRDEDAVELRLLQGLGQLDPVLYLVEAPRLVLWVPPQAGCLVATTCACGPD